MGDGPVVELEGAPRLEFEEEVAPFPIDEEGWIAGAESHAMKEIAATARLKTIPITTTQITTLVNFLFCIVSALVD